MLIYFINAVTVLTELILRYFLLGPNDHISTMLIFPYFLESHVIQSLPSFNMLDYKVGKFIFDKLDPILLILQYLIINFLLNKHICFFFISI